MRDMFNIETQIGGAWQLEGAVLQIESGEDLIVNQAGFTYGRGIGRFSPLNSSREYLTTGRAQGQLSLGAIIGPSKGIVQFMKQYSDPCNVKQNVIGFQPAGIRDCETTENNANPLEFVLRGILLQNLNVNVQQIGGGLSVVGAGMQMFFLTLELPDS